MLAMFLLGTGETLPRGNAMKNVVLGVANAVAAVGFVFFASIAWSAALPLAIGLFVGAGSARGWCGGPRRRRCAGHRSPASASPSTWGPGLHLTGGQ